MKNILCFGDSNTYGMDKETVRFSRDVRWTGKLQTLLDDEYYVIEEGLNGRTTVFDDPMMPGRNGMRALPGVLQTHIPLDLVILMLGTNDCKRHFAASGSVIAKAAGKLCKAIQQFDYDILKAPQILLVSPIEIGDEVVNRPFTEFDSESVIKAREFPAHYRQIANDYGCMFFDAATVAKPRKEDHIHLNAEGHASLAEALAKEIKKMEL